MDLDVWANIPDHIIVNIFSNLSLNDRYHASLVCKSWQMCFHSQYLWRKFVFNLNQYDVIFQNFKECILQHGRHFRNVSIILYQKDEEKRQCAIEVINQMAKIKKCNLQKYNLQKFKLQKF